MDPIKRWLKHLSDGFHAAADALKDAANPIGRGLKTIRRSTGLLEKVPFAGALFRGAHMFRNWFATNRTIGLLKVMASDLKTKLIQLIEKLIKALAKETEKNGAAALDARKRESTEKKEPAPEKKAAPSKEREMDAPFMKRDADGLNAAPFEKGRDVARKEPGKKVPVVDLSEKLSAAARKTAPVAGPGMEAGVKAVTKLAGR